MKDSAFLQGVHHAYAQTDGTYAWPDSREGDLLREGKHEIERLRNALNQISLCSVNSASSKDECGRIARTVLATKHDANCRQ